MATSLNLPPGFVLEGQAQEPQQQTQQPVQAQGPKLPPGFVLEAPPQQGVNIAPNGRTVIGPEADLKTKALNMLPNVSPEAIPNAIRNQPQIAKDLETIPTNFLNQLTMNHLRSINNAGNGDIPFEAQNPVINAGAKVAGITGAVMSPLNKLAIMKALGPGKLLAKAGQGALAGAAYAPNDNPLDVGKRAEQGVVNSVLGPAVSKVIEKVAPSASQVTSKIVDLYKKAVRPTVAGRSTPALTEKYDKNVLDGIDAIVANQENLNHSNQYGHPVVRPPQTMPEFVDAGFKTMDDTFNKYDAMAKATTGKGISIPLKGIGQDLRTAVNNFATKTHTPDVYQYANEVANKYDKQATLTPTDVQQVTQKLNAILKNFYRNPSYQMTGRDQIDAMIAGKLRNSMDQAITQAQGPGYQQIKNQYGALSSIMKDVLRRSNALDNRAPDEGLGRFANIWITGKIVGGLAHGNPASVAAGAAELGAKSYMRWRNDANTMVKDIFNLAQSRKTFGGKGTFYPGQPPTSLNKLALPNPQNTPIPMGQAKPMALPAPEAPLPAYLKDRQNIPPLDVPRETLPKYLQERQNIPDINAVPTPEPVSKVNPPKAIELPGQKRSVTSQTNQSNPTPKTPPKSSSPADEMASKKRAFNPQAQNLNDLMKSDLESQAMKKRTLAGGAATLATLGASSQANAMAKAPINDKEAIKTLLGEAENQGASGMQDIASVIRNRGTLQGAYGGKSIVEKDGKFFSNRNGKLRQIPDSVVKDAVNSWNNSKTKNTANGANHWFSTADLQTPKVQKMIKDMKFVKKSGSQSLYKGK